MFQKPLSNFGNCVVFNPVDGATAAKPPVDELLLFRKMNFQVMEMNGLQRRLACNT
jgi:hypothetical protein